MQGIISFTTTQLQTIWNLVASTWILSSIVVVGVLNLVATLVINTMGNHK